MSPKRREPTSSLRRNVALSLAYGPLCVLPPVTGLLLWRAPEWELMWLLALSIFFGCKWLTAVTSPHWNSASRARQAGYLLLWPGMDANEFLDHSAKPTSPRRGEWTITMLNLLLGLGLIYLAAPTLHKHELLAGWVGMVGIVLVLHCGMFHLLSLLWRLAGVSAEPIMNAPVLATSLTEFWGRRWNRAFHHLSYSYIFRPLVGRLGVAWSTMIVFFGSGVIHDLIISVPVRGGWGWPTAYFVLQGVGLLFERSAAGKRLGLGRGIIGRLYCAAMTLLPVVWLFPRPFLERAIVPTLVAIGAF